MYYTRVTRMCAFGHAVMKQNETKKKKKKKNKNIVVCFSNKQLNSLLH